jgi:excisionase family DNA binding protein
MEKNPPEKLLCVAEVAERLGLRVSTIRAWVLHRRIEVVRVGRRAIRIPISAVQKIIEAGTIPALERR